MKVIDWLGGAAEPAGGVLRQMDGFPSSEDPPQLGRPQEGSLSLLHPPSGASSHSCVTLGKNHEGLLTFGIS